MDADGEARGGSISGTVAAFDDEDGIAGPGIDGGGL
jgi:hypothetical protein